MSELLTEPVDPTELAPGPSRLRRPWSPGTEAALRGSVVLVAVLVAYHHSLSTLIDGLGVDSPLAYLGLVPIIGFMMIAVAIRPAVGEPDVHDRYLDRMLGIVGLAIPVAVMLVLPARLSTFFWMWRLDLVTLPLFVGAAIALVFGTRTLFRVRAGVLFLVLAWPLPFRWAMNTWLEPFSGLTVRAIRGAMSVVPVAKAVGNPADASFEIAGPAGPIRVVIATVCSGANSLVGFLLVALAVLAVSTGPRRQKWRWVLVGSAAVWALNVIRIVTILVMGKFWGEDFAIGVLHPVIGLMLFAGGVGFLVLWLLPRMGISLGRPGVVRRSLGDDARRAVPRWRMAGSVVLVAGLVIGVLDAGLVDVDPISSALGVPRISRFERAALHLPGFTGRRSDHFDWTTRYFGEDSDWTRYEFAGPGIPGLRSNLPIMADVITASDSQPFEDFGVEACYRFHGYDVSDVSEVDLGNGVVASMLTWHDPRHEIRWVTLFWYWAVTSGTQTKFQRIVLLLDADKSGRYEAPKLDSRLTAQLGISVDQALRGAGQATVSGSEAAARSFLVGFGRHIVSTNANHDAKTDQ